MHFLLLEQIPDEGVKQLHSQTEELIQFISFLNMGKYYSGRLRSLIGYEQPKKIEFSTTQEYIRNFNETNLKDQQHRKNYVNKVYKNTNIAIELISQP